MGLIAVHYAFPYGVSASRYYDRVRVTSRGHVTFAGAEEARREDLAAGSEGDVVFPFYKNLYGKAPSGTNFITDLQTSLIQLDWVRLPHCPGTFMKRCSITNQRMIIANYVDDFAAVRLCSTGLL